MDDKELSKGWGKRQATWRWDGGGLGCRDVLR